MPRLGPRVEICKFCDRIIPRGEMSRCDCIGCDKWACDDCKRHVPGTGSESAFGGADLICPDCHKQRIDNTSGPEVQITHSDLLNGISLDGAIDLEVACELFEEQI